MFSRTFFSRALLVTAVLAVYTPASAAVFSGTLYYTNWTGGQNVNKITYSYNDATHAFGLGSPTNVASTNGADGIIFAPNGNLLIGGQGSGNVYEVNPNTGAVVNTQFTGNASYHLTLNPNGNSVYTSDFGGALHTLSVPIGSGSATQAISGSERGLTQVAFGNSDSVFYVNGNPNGFGNVGMIDLSTGVTTRLYTSVQPAHGIIFDPFTDLITMFGAGRTGTINATDGSGLLTSGGIFQVGDFDQGAVDGKGHALVAGSDAITFIDYSISHDITHPDFTTTLFGFSGIDDVAPLVGAGSDPTPNPVPVPGTLALLGLGIGILSVVRWKRV